METKAMMLNYGHMKSLTFYFEEGADFTLDLRLNEFVETFSKCISATRIFLPTFDFENHSCAIQTLIRKKRI